jgi:hypothetical protein
MEEFVVVAVILWIGIGGAVGGICGESQGRSGLGVVLGILAGPLGWIAAASLEPSAKVRLQREERFADEIASHIVKKQSASGGQQLRKVTAQPQHPLAPTAYLGLEPGFYVDPLDEFRERYWSGGEWDTETYPLEKGIKPANPSQLGN